MKDRLFHLLGIESEEKSMVYMLLTQSVFLGIFFGAFDISAHSLFLSIFDEKAMAKAYVVSGLAGIILTATYTWLQARMPFRNFAVTNLFFITFLTLLLWVILLIYPSGGVIFGVFVMFGPLNILAMLSFWGTTGRLFTLRQGKRLFGLVDAGLVVGIIISCYAIPVLLSLNFRSHNILLISTLSVFSASVIQVMTGRKFTFAVTETPKAKKSTGLSVFREDQYIRIMGLFIALSVMTAFFVQYSFMAVTRLQYPLEEDMARFLGLFTGSMMIFTLLIKLLVFSYLIRNYGLRTCLALSPVLIAGLTAIAIGIGLTMGYTPVSVSGFVIFFLILAMSRLFSKSLKDSIESPSFKVIYQTVDEKIRYEVQSGIDGTVNEISALFSGLLLAGLGAISFIKLIHFSGVLFVIIAAWIFVAFRLYAGYRNTIRRSLEVLDNERSGTGVNEKLLSLSTRTPGTALFRDNYFKIITGDLSSLENSTNTWFFRQIIDEAERNQDLNSLPALKRIVTDNKFDEALRHKAAGVADQLEGARVYQGKLKRTVDHLPDKEKIIKARKSLADSRMPQTTEILRLLRDNNIESRRLAIYMIGKFRLADMIPDVCNCLGVQGLEKDASLVLESFGSAAYSSLTRAFFSSSGNIPVCKGIIMLLGKSNDREITDFLFARLWSNSRGIKEIAAEQLVVNNYVADKSEQDRLNQLVSEIIGMLTWNISAQVVLGGTDNLLLKKVIEKETSAWNTFLFNILSIAYERGSIEKIRSNIENGTVASINYALEMIDIVIDESLKPKLISLIDAVPDVEKLKNLHQFYPGVVPDYEQLIEDILNRDYNIVSVWAKACALRTLQSVPSENLAESVVALLFSPEKILFEESALLLGRSEKNLFDNVSSRLPEEKSGEIEKIISGKYEKREMLFEKTVFLSEFFPAIREDELLILSEHLSPAGSKNTNPLPGSGGYMLFSRNSTTGLLNTTIFNDEIVTSNWLSGAGNNMIGYILPLFRIDDFCSHYPERTFGIYKQIDQFETKKEAEG
jgi:ATP:ADP antiporter, AAA family